MNQREGVFKAVIAVLGEEPTRGVAVKLEKPQKEQVHALLVNGFAAGEIEYRGAVTREELKKYVPGLLNNWLRKDPRLNGNTKYVPKNPGVRQGSGDETMKALKGLLATLKDADQRAEVERAIEARKKELKPSMVIDVTKLPEHLRHLAPKLEAAAAGGEVDEHDEEETAETTATE